MFRAHKKYYSTTLWNMKHLLWCFWRVRHTNGFGTWTAQLRDWERMDKIDQLMVKKGNPATWKVQWNREKGIWEGTMLDCMNPQNPIRDQCSGYQRGSPCLGSYICSPTSLTWCCCCCCCCPSSCVSNPCGTWYDTTTRAREEGLLPSCFLHL